MTWHMRCLLVTREAILLLHMNFAKGKNKTYAKNNLWIRMMKEMPSLEKEYDLAIGYWGDRTMFYVVDKVKAKHKMAWMHFNFNSPPISPKTYKKYINKLDRIVAVLRSVRNQ